MINKERGNKPGPKPRELRRRIAFCLDYRGQNDDELVFLFKGATEEILRQTFDFLCADGKGIAKGYRIASSHDVVHLRRHCYERLEIWLDDINTDFSSLQDIVTLIDSHLKTKVKGDVDFYLVDDFLNLTDRRPDAVQFAWQALHQNEPMPMAMPQSKNITNNETINEIMPKMYVRVPGYVAGFFRGRNDDYQLKEFDAYEFPDHDDLMLFLEHHLRLIPEQNQSVFCLSERAFNHILHGKQPGGGKQVLNRNPEEWPTMREICALTGKFVTDKQDSSDYLCIAIPKEILDGGRLHRTNGSYALPKKEAERFVGYLKQEFKREFEAFCEVDEMNCLENGINRSDVDRMERFFANYNMPISVDNKDRESLRKLMFRMRKRKNIQPYLRRKLDPFVTHISEDDMDKAERLETKKRRLKKKQDNEC